jgi:hypothetical protein
MTKPAHPQPAPEKLLGLVAEALKALEPRELDEVARDCDASPMTLKNIRDDKTGRLGPSHLLVVRLYSRLVTSKATH